MAAVTHRSPTAARRRRALVCVVAAALAAGCSDDGGGTPVAARGRQVYLAQCTQCHHSDPAQAGPLGPPVKGSSRELLDAKILRGTYPEGYQPRRPTSVMPPQPTLAPEISALAEFLK